MNGLSASATAPIFGISTRLWSVLEISNVLKKNHDDKYHEIGCSPWRSLNECSMSGKQMRKATVMVNRVPTCCFSTLFIFCFSTLKKFIYLAVPGVSCGMWDLVPWLGIEPGLPALGAWSPSHWTARQVPYISPLFSHQSLGLNFLVPKLRCFNWAFGFVPFQLKWENHFQSTGRASSIHHQTYTKLLACEVAIWLAALFYQSPRLISWLKSFGHLQSSKLQIAPILKACMCLGKGDIILFARLPTLIKNI